MEVNALTATLTKFINLFVAAHGHMKPALDAVLWSLGSIEIALFGLFFATGGSGVRELIKKPLQLGFWVALVRFFPTWSELWLKSFMWLGATAAGAPGKQALMLDPSSIAGYGLDATEVLVHQIGDSGFNLGESVVTGLAYIAILICFLVMSIQVFWALVEAYMWMVMGCVAMPFWGFKHTRFISEKALGGMVSSGFKLFSLTFVVAFTEPLLRSLRFTQGDMQFNELAAMALSVGALSFLYWKAPQVAGGFIAGAPSLSAADASQTTANAAQTSQAAGNGAQRLVQGAAGLVSSAAGAIGSGAARAAGVLATGAREGAASAGADSSAAARAGAAVGGAAKAAGGAAWNAAKGAVSNAVNPVREAYRGGQAAAAEAIGGQPKKDGAGTDGAGGREKGGGGGGGAGPTASAAGVGGGNGRASEAQGAPAWASAAAKTIHEQKPAGR